MRVALPSRASSVHLDTALDEELCLRLCIATECDEALVVVRERVRDARSLVCA